MKFEINEIGKKEYYDEFIYIASKYRTFKKNPHRKSHQFTKNLLFWIVITIIYTLFLAYIYLKSHDVLFLFLIGMFCLTIIIELIYLFVSNKRIKMFMANNCTKFVEFNEEGIIYTDCNKEFKIRWEDIAHIIINKYGIFIIPNTVLNALMSLTVKYKKEVVDCLKKYNKESLLVDNSYMYK